MKFFGISGWSGSGKTTLLVRLVAALAGRGIEVATIKHSHHDIAVGDAETAALAAAGAVETVVASATRFAIVHELTAVSEPTLEDLAGRLGAVDLVLVEGFKHGRHAKLEVWDPSLGKPLLAAADDAVVALACDAPPPLFDRPAFSRGAIDDIAGFIRRYCGLGRA